ncbi:MAG: cytochrome c, partial [Pseudomonadota bacterium]
MKQLRHLSFAVLVAFAVPAVAEDAPSLYRQHCATCHGVDRLGAVGPALLPENLGRLKKTEAV